MTEAVHSVMTPQQQHELLTNVTVIRSDVGWMRDDAKDQRAVLVALAGRMTTVENGRLVEKAAADERAKMMKWLWSSAVAVATVISGAFTFAVNAYVKLGAPHP
jgi:hypothetical protein